MRRPCARLGPAVVAAALLAGAAGISPVALRAPAARATSTPPPTPVNGSPSPFPTALRTPRPSVTPPRLASAAAILEDLDTGQVLFAKNADAPRPVASLTKIMTALLALSHSRPEERVTVSSLAAGQSGSVLGLRVGERITVSELMYALLLQSSNDAAVALAEHAGGTLGRFVEMMNEEAARLGLTRTRFYSASGLDDRGRSSARDLATLTRAAYADPLFEQIAATKFHTVPSPSGKPRRIQNRNILLWLYPGAIGVKTGFTTPSGHCLVATADHDGVRLLAVALGAPGHDAGTVFYNGATLLNYGYAAFVPHPLIHAGDPVGPFRVEGRNVPAVAASTLLRLVHVDDLGTATISVYMDAGLTLPVRAGETIGRVDIRLHGRRVGRVLVVAPVTVTAAPPPRPPRLVPPDPAADPLERGVSLLRALVQTVLGAFL